ncbi:MAG: DUF3536 domain-containing protein, partial [Sphaerochaetaceae bacterium]|nr:DUF3536 domain-containing protein [Sphaerochaetaceae bacterium]
SKNETIQIATMLEAFKNVMFSYTSCGWFFNDISGIEPRQNISYAVYAATLLDKMYKTSFCEDLLKDLSKAKSNIIVEGTGADIARKDMPKNSGEASACAYFAVNRRVAYKKNFVNSFGFYRLTSINNNQAKILNTRTLKTYSFEFKATPYSSGALAYIVTDKETGLSTKINLAEASSKTLEIITSWVEDRLSSNLSEKFVDRIADHIGNYLILLEADRSLAKDTVFIENIGSCIKALKYIILSDRNIPADKLESRIKQLLFFIRIKGRPVEVQEINRVFTLKLRRYGKEIRQNFTTDLAQKTLNLLRVARSEGFNPDITKLQDAVFEHVDHKPEEIPQDLWKDLLYNLNFSRDHF